MTPSKILLFILLSFIGGVFISSFFGVPRLIIYELFALGVFYSLIFFKQKAIVVFGFCLMVLTLGVLRTDIAKPTELTASGTPSTLLVRESGPLSFLKQKFRDVINQSLSPPQSSILGAILLGDQKEISKEWKEKLNRAGVRHVTAISGMHIVVLAAILLWLGIALGLYRGQAFYFAVGFLWLFILLIGFQPSAVRAAIMGSMFLFCEKIGRLKSADRALILTAAIMLAFDPRLLRHSIGFQLSFLAVLGIIYLMPFFQTLFQKGQKITQKMAKKLKMPINPLQSVFRELADLLSMTFAAQVFTLPILIYNFGSFSLVSPITNILIVPLLSFVMGAGFLFLIAGVLWQPLALIFLFPAWLLLTYMVKIVDLFSRLSFSYLTLQISWLWLPVSYFILGFFLWQIKKRQKLKLLP